MIANFMTTFPKGSGKLTKKATYFVEKIHSGLTQNLLMLDLPREMWRNDFNLQKLAESQPKIHTIREDKHNRWKVGMMIDFFINSRTKKAFRFAPRVPVKNLQTIKIKRTDHLSMSYYPGQMFVQSIFIGGVEFKRSFIVEIDGKMISHRTLIKLAINDGFDSIDDFFNWFCDDFEGKIIHWTDLKY